MAEVKVIIRTADRTRKAEVSVARDMTGSDLIQGAVTNWSLPTDNDYALVNVTKSRTIVPQERLSEAVVADGDEIEVQPVLVAGR